MKRLFNILLLGILWYTMVYSGIASADFGINDDTLPKLEPRDSGGCQCTINTSVFGNLSGSGTSNQLAYFDTASSVKGIPSLLYSGNIWSTIYLYKQLDSSGTVDSSQYTFLNWSDRNFRISSNILDYDSFDPGVEPQRFIVDLYTDIKRNLNVSSNISAQNIQLNDLTAGQLLYADSNKNVKGTIWNYFDNGFYPNDGSGEFGYGIGLISTLDGNLMFKNGYGGDFIKIGMDNEVLYPDVNVNLTGSLNARRNISAKAYCNSTGTCKDLQDWDTNTPMNYTNIAMQNQTNIFNAFQIINHTRGLWITNGSYKTGLNLYVKTDPASTSQTAIYFVPHDNTPTNLYFGNSSNTLAINFAGTTSMSSLPYELVQSYKASNWYCKYGGSCSAVGNDGANLILLNGGGASYISTGYGFNTGNIARNMRFLSFVNSTTTNNENNAYIFETKTNSASMSGVNHTIWRAGTDTLMTLSGTGNLNIYGNLSVKRPYGMFSSTATFTVASADTAYPFTFNYTEDSYQISKSSDNMNFTFQQTGEYLIELSIVAQSSASAKRANIWVQKNGVNVARSNTPYDFKSNNAIAVIAVPFILEMNTTDTFRVMYGASGTEVSFPYVTNTSYAPETPSAIMTITKISEIS